jgi:primase-polymerase (primpol)-like protein
MKDKNIKILKTWKGENDWFSVGLEDCLDKLEGNINLSNTEIIEALKDGATLQSFNALYKAE